MHPFDILVELVDLSLVRPLGLVKDVVVRVDSLSFHVDFYVVNVNTSTSPSELFVLLGIPFLKTVKVVVNVDKWSLRIKHGDQILNLYNVP